MVFLLCHVLNNDPEWQSKATDLKHWNLLRNFTQVHDSEYMAVMEVRLAIIFDWSLLLLSMAVECVDVFRSIFFHFSHLELEPDADGENTKLRCW